MAWHPFKTLFRLAIIVLSSQPGGALAQCLSDADLVRIADAGKRSLEGQKYVVSTQGATGLPFDFSFAPANYTSSGVNPSSRYIVPRVGPWREGDIGGDSFLNWGIGEVDTLNSRQAVVVVMCSPPPTRMWSLEAAILYRLNLTDNPQPGASISNTENSATMPEARADAPLLVIMTPDRSTEAAVRMAFELSNANFSVATIAINGTADVLHFGQKPIVEGCDIFQLCMRVHASPAQTATSAFQTPTTEAGLDTRRAVLIDAVVNRMQTASLGLRLNVSFHPVELNKRRCLLDRDYHPYGSGNCYGTSSDGRYTLSDQYTLPSGNMSSLVVVVVGTNHAATGNAADNQLLHDTTVVVNPEGLEGSADFYLGATAKPADAGLFAHAFAERCSVALFGPYCSKVDPQQGGAAGALLRLEAYLDNLSGTRPSFGLVHPVALVFLAD